MATVIVTRPVREAERWVRALQEAGHDACALPLIDIADGPDPAHLSHCRQALARFDALMFVSAQAVDRFWAVPGPPAAAHPGPRCWAPGPGTARALALAGVPLHRIDAPPETAGQFDSEALWPVVRPQAQAGRRLLVVHGVSAHGASGRDWLDRQWLAAGGQVERCAAYRRQPPVWDSAMATRVRAWAAGPPVWWLFSSSEALSHLHTACPQQDWSSAQALATHPRIAAAAQALGFGHVRLTRPALPDVLHSLESVA